MNRRDFLKCLGGSLVLPALHAAGSKPVAARPNELFIALDE